MINTNELMSYIPILVYAFTKLSALKGYISWEKVYFEELGIASAVITRTHKSKTFTNMFNSRIIFPLAY